MFYFRLFEKLGQLLKELKIIDETFGGHVFSVTIYGLAMMMISVFLFVSDLQDIIHEGGQHVMFYILGISHILIALMLYFIFLWANMASQKIIEGIDEVKEQIMKLNYLQNYQATMNDQLIPANEAKELILYQLGKFQGLSGYGYFYLRKDLLPAVFANIFTYCIVLVQFKISE